MYNVFNVGQTNIQEARPELYKKLQEQNLPKRPEGYEEADRFEFPAMDKMIRENKWICPIHEVHGDDAYFSISKNEIVIPERMQFADNESFFSNLYHECIHSTGHESQLNRLKPASFGSAAYAREELVAEVGAALVASRYGLTKHVKEDSAAYIKSWLDSIKESPKFIKTVLADVKVATRMLCNHIDKVQLSIDEENAKAKEMSNNIEAKTNEKNEKKPEMLELDIPKWSLCYIINGDSEGLSEDEKKIVDTFLDEHFPDGFIPEIQEGKDQDFNISPAFGTRNPNALPNKGESPYQAVDTCRVNFYPSGYFESQTKNDDNYTYEVVADNTKESVAAKGIPGGDHVDEQEEHHFHRGR